MTALLLAAWLSLAPASELGGPMVGSPQAPDVYKVRFETTEGSFVVKVVRAQAPHGADRFHELASTGYFTDAIVFRVLDGFVAQWGIHGDPELAQAWRNRRIPDDPVAAPNKKKTLTFAMAGPNTRTTQVFVNLANNAALDDMGFAPIGKVVAGWGTVKRFFDLYGDGPPKGSGPDQTRIYDDGNSYLRANYPRLTAIKRATVL